MLKSLRTLLNRLRPTRLAPHYRRMHEQGAFPGVSWRAHVETLRRAVPNVADLAILDFGCGPSGGLSKEFPRVTPYDPFVPAYAADPWAGRYDLVFSSDVLEHLSVAQAADFLAKAKAASPRHVFLNVSTRPAHKNLPDGTNAHLTVKPAEWWLAFTQDQLGPAYRPALAQADLLRAEVTLLFGRST